MTRTTLALGALLAACAGTPPPAARAPTPPPAAPPPPSSTVAPEDPPGDDGFSVEGTVGTVDPAAVEEAMAARRAAVNGCFGEAAAGQAWLAGTLAFKARLDQAGTVKSVVVEQPLGNLAVERCVLGVVRGIRFPRPSRGAEAEFDYALAFRGKMTVVPWGEAEVGRVMTAHRAVLADCARGARASRPPPQSVRVAFFVLPGGVARSVGVGGDRPLDDTYAACVAQQISRWRFADPRGRVARAEYQF